MSGKPVEGKSLFLIWRPNRSLSRAGRQLWLGLIVFAVVMLAAGATALGAWMVLPFAGAEILLVWLAFKVIAVHDSDYETLRISDQDFCWERSDGGRIHSLRGNRAWVKVMVGRVGGKCCLSLSYAGKCVMIASLLSDEQRQSLSRELALVLGQK